MLAAALAVILVLIYVMSGGLSGSSGTAGFSTQFPIEFSELMSSNDAYPAGDGSFCDWLELHNTSDAEIDISGFRLTDNKNAVKFTFPSDTVLQPDEYLVVCCDAVYAGTDKAAMGISKDGGEQIILQNKQHVTIDTVDTVALERNSSMARNAAGQWEVTAEATPGFENSEAGREAYLASMTVAEPAVIITELMAKNEATLLDADGVFCDWIELTNVSGSDVDLTGWYLSDDETKPYAWSIPSGTIAAGQSLVIYASGEDGIISGEIHTDFSLSASGETVTLSTADGKRSSTVACGALETDRSWFRSEDGSWASTLEVSPGFANNDAGRRAWLATLTAKTLGINEAMTANDLYLLRGTEYYDWVELRNNSGSDLSLSGYYLSDDVNEPEMWALPDVTLAPGELFIVFCSGDESLTGFGDYHANFSLNAVEDRLYVFGPDGEVLDYVLLTGLTRRGSMGRIVGEGGFFYFDTPTPDEENSGGARAVTASPEALTAQGVYSDADSLTVELSGDGEIYYTLDGSDPDETSERYSGPIKLTDTTVVRAAAKEKGKLLSRSVTASYIIGVEYTMPVVSLVTDPDNLWSAETGIYYAGNHINYNQNWERDAVVSLFELDGSGFTQNCGVKLHGATSRFVTDKKTLKLVFRGRYGDATLNYDLFGDGEITTYGSILLRAGVDAIYPTLIKDSLFALLAKEGSDTLLSMDSRFCILYINGEYWGIYAIREAMSEEYYASHCDVPPDTVTAVNPTESSRTEYQTLKSFAEYKNMADDENYAYMEEHVDVENIIDWCIFEAYAGNEDIWNNLRFYHSTAGDGKWRYALVDLDLTWILHSDGFEETAMKGYHSVIPNSLLSNKQFRQLFMERASALLGGVLSDEHVVEKIEEMAAELRPEITADRELWGGSLAQWERSVQGLCDFVQTGTGRAAQTARSCVSLLHMTDEETEKYFGEVLG